MQSLSGLSHNSSLLGVALRDVPKEAIKSCRLSSVHNNIIIISMIMLLRFLKKGLNDNQDQVSQVFQIKKGTSSPRSAVSLNAKKTFQFKRRINDIGF